VWADGGELADYRVPPPYQGYIMQTDLGKPRTIDMAASRRRWLDTGSFPNYGFLMFVTQNSHDAFSAATYAISWAGDSNAILASSPQVYVLWAYGLVLTSTPTGAPTATRTQTPTATPTPMPGLYNESCADSSQDFNGDDLAGSVDDRVVELSDADLTGYDLQGHRLVWDNSLNTSYTFPHFTHIWPHDWKAICSRQIRNPIAKSFDLPGRSSLTATGGSPHTVALNDAAGVLLDSFQYNRQGAGACWGRYPNGGPGWVVESAPSVGAVNR